MSIIYVCLFRNLIEELWMAYTLPMFNPLNDKSFIPTKSSPKDQLPLPILLINHPTLEFNLSFMSS